MDRPNTTLVLLARCRRPRRLARLPFGIPVTRGYDPVGVDLAPQRRPATHPAWQSPQAEVENVLHGARSSLSLGLRGHQVSVAVRRSWTVKLIIMTSSGLSSTSAAARFSLRWALELVPGIGMITGEW
jgi:hypothetical protein